MYCATFLRRTQPNSAPEPAQRDAVIHQLLACRRLWPKGLEPVARDVTAARAGWQEDAPDIALV